MQIAEEVLINDRGRVVGAASDGDRTYATFLHLSGGVLSLFTAVPALIAPLVMWLARKNMSPFIDDHGREAVNFWLTMIVYGLVLALLALPTLFFSLLLGLPALFLFGVYGVISATFAANRGEIYRYPMCIRFIPGPR